MKVNFGKYFPFCNKKELRAFQKTIEEINENIDRTMVDLIRTELSFRDKVLIFFGIKKSIWPVCGTHITFKRYKPFEITIEKGKEKK